MQGLLEYRAGGRALALIRKDGFALHQVRALVGSASGPKWLVLAGVDRALLAAGLLERRDPLLLVGASAGAWRMLALAAPSPEATHRALQQSYISQVFPEGVTPRQITAAYRTMLGELFPEQVADHVVHHPVAEVAVHVARGRGPAGSPMRWVQALAMLAAAGCDQVAATSMGWFFERVLLHTRPERYAPPFDGVLARLDAANLQAAALATASVPLYFEPVRDLGGAPAGRYVDGGMCDYHLRQAHLPPGQGIVLFPHFQRRIVPNWFDRYNRRRLAPEVRADLLQVFPSAAHVASLPGGAIPTRDDFKRWIHEPEERIRRWQLAAEASERLGEQLLEDLRTGRLAELVQAM